MHTLTDTLEPITVLLHITRRSNKEVPMQDSPMDWMDEDVLTVCDDGSVTPPWPSNKD